MAWEHLSITRPHLVYIILGGFTSLFMLCSTIIKERMYIGEATVATLCGLIFGPHAADLIVPSTWGNQDIVTIEFSRIVLVVQCFAVGVELPKFYMEKHWRSVIFLLGPVMIWGWLITSLFVWWMVEPLNWLESLVVAACVTATDPVLASSVVGKGKFAKRLPKHLRDLLSAESGCNDGMAFPFVYLALYLIQDNLSAKDVTFHWIVYTILYECLFGTVFGFLIGFVARHGIKFAERRELIDRESFLVFYFVLALFCAGSGSILGVDDLLVGFAAGVGFSNDGWFTQKTEESHVSNVIDLLLNLTYFVYLGTIIPWEMYNSFDLGLSAWRLSVLAILVILFRRIPIMLAVKPLIPDIKTWREALFAGHFGPIGVGAIFVAILTRAELESDHPVPLAAVPTDPATEHLALITLVWPVVTFLVIASILVHGSTIAVFTLGKHINTLTITMSYTAAPEDGPSWMNRLPRISSQSRSQARNMSDTEVEELKMPNYPPGTLPPVGLPGQFLRRVKEEDNSSRQGSRASSVSRRRNRKKWDDGIGPGGPISQSAIFPQRRTHSQTEMAIVQGNPSSKSRPDQNEASLLSPSSPPSSLLSPLPPLPPAETGRGRQTEREAPLATELKASGQTDSPRQDSFPRFDLDVYDEGGHLVAEKGVGEMPSVESHDEHAKHAKALQYKLEATAERGGWTIDMLKRKFDAWRVEEMQKRKDKERESRKHEPARAYQFGNTIIVEDEDGEVVKKYELPAPGADDDRVSQGLKYVAGGLIKPGDDSNAAGDELVGGDTGNRPKLATRSSTRNWFSRTTTGEPSTPKPRKKPMEELQDEDDRHIRFTIGGVGKRMNKADFLTEMKKLDKSTRKQVVDQSDASQVVKTLAKQDATFLDAGQSMDQASVPRGKAPASPYPEKASVPVTPLEGSSNSDSSSGKKPASPSSSGSRSGSVEAPETAVERRRRLAVLKSVDDKAATSTGEAGESPAERRRREAALGVPSTGTAGYSDDSDDEDTLRVPPARRGIRFADVPPREQI